MARDTDELRAYVRRAFEAGHAPDAIRATLDRAGWDAPRIERALGAWAAGADGLAVPRPHAQLSAREAFLYLTMFAALWLTAWHLGALLFHLIELAVDDPAEARWRDGGRLRSIRWAVATLIVALPVYLGLGFKLAREMRRDPARRQSPVRLWLGHITLFVAAITVMGVLISMVFGLLSGELTLRFALKLATIAGIAAAIFGHYRADLRRPPGRAA